MADLGTALPSFQLRDVRTGRMVECPGTMSGRPVLVMFICRHCPFVMHVRQEIARVGRDYAGRVDIFAISSNDAANFPDDSPERLKQMAEELKFTFPLCHDETQAVAKQFAAACTPDFFLYNAAHRLAYRGQLDGSRPGNGAPVDGRDLRAALDALLAGRQPAATQYPSIGCNIKWKAGNQPEYFASAVVRK